MIKKFSSAKIKIRFPPEAKISSFSLTANSASFLTLGGARRRIVPCCGIVDDFRTYNWKYPELVWEKSVQFLN